MPTLPRSLYSFSIGLFKAMGMIDESWVRAKAFDDIHDRLFRLRWVKAVAAKGFAKPSSSSPDTILVITDTVPTSEMQEEVDEIVGVVNHRFGVRMKPTVVDRMNSAPATGQEDDF